MQKKNYEYYVGLASTVVGGCLYMHRTGDRLRRPTVLLNLKIAGVCEGLQLQGTRCVAAIPALNATILMPRRLVAGRGRRRLLEDRGKAPVVG
jgi:hypothetical protein